MKKIDRRGFIKRAGIGSAIAAAAPRTPVTDGPGAEAATDPLIQRRNAAYQCRLKAAEIARTRPLPLQVANGDEARYRSRIASFSKGLPHNALGEVDLRAYGAMVDAVASGDPALLEAIPMGGPRKLVSPQASLAFDLEGADCASLTIPPAPELASPNAASELVELYWMALARDVAFVEYDHDPIVAAAARLRPEAMAGLVHHQVSRMAERPLDASVTASAAVARTQERFGSALLPQVYPEGCPLHPSYGAGHATVAGACVTILKAWFDEDFVLPNPVVADASGLQLLPYDGPPLTVGHELDKLAANVAFGRNAAGIHYRSDYWESVQLGEQVALTILQEQKDTYNERVTFSLTLFDGTKTSI